MSKKSDKSDGAFYETEVVCKNCKNKVEVSIPMGKTVKEYIQKNKCDICKCLLK